ncbi:MAG: hypothetical protein ACKV19_03360 [Verrucomicrobiales bacterium]
MKRNLLAWCGVGVVLSGIGVWGQEAAPPPATPGETSVPSVVAFPGAAVEPVAREERRVFVPFEDLEKTLKDHGQGVFLPYREFLEMWNQLSAQREKIPEPPPTDSLLTSAEYTGRVEGEVAVIDALLRVESFKDGWAVLPLGGPGMNMAKAETGEATLRLGEKGPEVILPKKGRYELKLQILAKVQRSAGKYAVMLRPPRTAVSKLELSIPEVGWEFTTKPAAAFTAQPSADGRTQFAVFFGETEEMEIAWQKAGEESKLTPLVFADVGTRCELTAGALRTTVDVHYSLLRAGVGTFELAVPAGHEVLAARGVNIREWTVTAAPDGQQLVTVALHAPAKESFALSLELESPVGSLPATLALPSVEARGVVRQRGSVEVTVASELEAAVKELQGLTQQAVAVAAPNQAAPGHPLLGSWRYLKLPFALSLAAKKAEPVVEVESLTRLHVLPDLASFAARFDYAIKRAGLFSVVLRVPDGWTNLDITGDQVEGFSEEVSGEGANQRRLVTVKFKGRVDGATSLTLTGRQLRDSPESDLTLPVIVPEQAAKHEALIGVQVDETLETLTRQPGGLQPEDVAALMQKAAARQSQDSAAPAFTLGFRSRGEAAPAVLGFQAKKPQVSGEVLTLTEVREQSVVHHSWLVFDILYSGVDSFVISMPKDLAADVRMETKTLKETVRAFQPAQNPDPAREYWKLVARDKVRGRFVVELSLEKPWGGLEPGKTIETTVPEMALHDIFQESGQIAVVKVGNLEVLAPAAGATLEPVDPNDLAAELRRPGIFLAYKWKRHPATLTLPVMRNELVEVPQAMVTYADVTTVVSTDGAATTEVVYWLQNNTQQYLTLRLPAGGKLLSDVTVAGVGQQPQRRSGGEAANFDLLVRLPAAEKERKVFPVRFVYDVPGAGEPLGLLGKLAVPAPELLDAAILQTQVTLFLPAGFAYHDFQGPLHLPVQERGWSRLRRAFGWLIPALGPQIPEQRERPWPAPPQVEAAQRGGFEFQIPRDGVPFQLHRLDRPATIDLSFRTKKLEHTVEALGLLTALCVGLLLSRSGLRTRIAFVLVGGLGALVCEGVAPSSLSGFLKWFYLGVVISVGWWLVLGVVRLARSQAATAQRQPTSGPPPPDTPAPSVGSPPETPVVT